VKDNIFSSQGYCGQAEVDANHSTSEMIWMNLKSVDQPGNVFYAVNLVTWTQIVPPLGLAELLGVDEAPVDEKGEEETRRIRYNLWSKYYNL
jgi:hypothetical protein